MQSIVILGGGNMGGAMAQSWQQAGGLRLHVVEMDAARREALTKLGIACVASLAEAPKADAYLLAIKPQHYAETRPSIAAHCGHDAPLILSIMAGIGCDQLAPLSPHVVRVMPNLPALIGESMSVLYTPALDTATRATLTRWFEIIGRTAWVEQEDDLHAVTAISGSGPAYLFALMEALTEAAIAQGLSPALADTLVRQTIKGAALLAAASPLPAGTLRAQVTSKGGTTEAALASFAAGGLSGLVADAVTAAAHRSRVLAG